MCLLSLNLREHVLTSYSETSLIKLLKLEKSSSTRRGSFQTAVTSGYRFLIDSEEFSFYTYRLGDQP